MAQDSRAAGGMLPFVREPNVYLGTLMITDEIKPGGRCDPAALADFWTMHVERDAAEMTH